MDDSEIPGPVAVQQPDGISTPMPDVNAIHAIVEELARLHVQCEPLQTALDAIKGEIQRLETVAHQAMMNAGILAVSTHAASLTIKGRVVYTPTDWPAIYEHIRATGEFDLLTRTLSSVAVRERDKAEQLPPGILRNEFNVLKFSPTKR